MAQLGPAAGTTVRLHPPGPPLRRTTGEQAGKPPPLPLAAGPYHLSGDRGDDSLRLVERDHGPRLLIAFILLGSAVWVAGLVKLAQWLWR